MSPKKGAGDADAKAKVTMQAPISRSPYFNFLRDSKKKGSDGAQAWANLSDTERNHYKDMARTAKKPRKGNKKK